MAELNDSVEWRAIKDFPAYEVSEDGRVRRVTAPTRGPGARRSLPYEMTISYDSRGRPGVGLAQPGNRSGQQRHLISWLVAGAFLGAPPTANHVICHNNGNHADNRVTNLRWDTQVANMADKKIHGTNMEGSRHHKAKLTEADILDIRHARAAGETYVSIAKRYGVHFSLIQHIAAGRVWRHVT